MRSGTLFWCESPEARREKKERAICRKSNLRSSIKVLGAKAGGSASDGRLKQLYHNDFRAFVQNCLKLELSTFVVHKMLIER